MHDSAYIYVYSQQLVLDYSVIIRKCDMARQGFHRSSSQINLHFSDMRTSPLNRLESPVVFAVDHLRVVIYFEQSRVAAVTLRRLAIQNSDRCQHALLSNWHSLVVQATLGDLQVALTHIIALHQVGLDRWNVIELLKLDSIVDGWGLQERVALGVGHCIRVCRFKTRASSKLRLHQSSFLMSHWLEVNVGLFLHNHRTDLVLVV